MAVNKPKAEKIMSTGVGESKPFIAAEGSFEPGNIDWTKITINGLPIPEHMMGLVPYEMTDQGSEERNRGKQPRRVQIVRDETDNQIRHYRDDLTDDLPFDEQSDPLRIAMEKHTPAGHRGMFISRMKADKDGLRRGRIDWQPVLVDGKEVTVGGMFLASVPERVAERADRFYAEMARSMGSAAGEKVREHSEQLISAVRPERRKGADFEFGAVDDSEDGELAIGAELGAELEG